MTDDQEIRGEAIHVGDCYIWAEIYYLDSPTDYREYISGRGLQPSVAGREKFVTLDGNIQFPWSAIAQFFMASLPMLVTAAWRSYSRPTP